MELGNGDHSVCATHWCLSEKCGYITSSWYLNSSTCWMPVALLENCYCWDGVKCYSVCEEDCRREVHFPENWQYVSLLSEYT